MMDHARPDILQLVRRCEAVCGVTLAEHDGRLTASPSGRLTNELRLQLAEHKYAILTYLRERSPLESLLDKVSGGIEREELLESFHERAAIQEIEQSADRETAIAVAWDELGRTLEQRRDRARRRCEEHDARRTTSGVTVTTTTADDAMSGGNGGGDRGRAA